MLLISLRLFGGGVRREHGLVHGHGRGHGDGDDGDHSLVIQSAPLKVSELEEREREEAYEAAKKQGRDERRRAMPAVSDSGRIALCHAVLDVTLLRSCHTSMM